jgi:hypothetical protein
MNLSKAFASFKLNSDMVSFAVSEAAASEARVFRLEDVLVLSGKHIVRDDFADDPDRLADEDGPQSDMERMLDTELSAEEKEKAAEAVVDAAICCHNLTGKLDISPATRSFLVQAVIADPSFTSRLFSKDIFEFSFC